MPFWTKLYSLHANLTGFPYNSNEKKNIAEFWNIIFIFQKYSWLLFYANILTIKLSNVWRDVNADVKFTFASHEHTVCLALELIRGVPNGRRHILGSLCGPTLICHKHVSVLVYFRMLTDLRPPIIKCAWAKIKAILRLWIYKALYDLSHLGSTTTMTTGEWLCLISFALAPLSCSEREWAKIQNENVWLQLDSNPGHATPRQVNQRIRPLDHGALMTICGLMSYRIVGYKLIKYITWQHVSNWFWLHVCIWTDCQTKSTFLISN